MKRFFFIIFSFFILLEGSVFAEIPKTNINTGHDLFTSDKRSSWGLIEFLGLAQSFLIKVVLPLVVVGASLYIAWELLTAEGNEEKMKKAWKSVTYSVIGLLMIGLSYAIISLVVRLSL